MAAMTDDPAQPLLETLGIDRPVLGAPMARIAGGALAAAVTKAGGLGFVGGGYGDRDWIRTQLAIAGAARVGIGLITWRLDEEPGLLDPRSHSRRGRCGCPMATRPRTSIASEPPEP